MHACSGGRPPAIEVLARIPRPRGPTSSPGAITALPITFETTCTLPNCYISPHVQAARLPTYVLIASNLQTFSSFWNAGADLGAPTAATSVCEDWV